MSGLSGLSHQDWLLSLRLFGFMLFGDCESRARHWHRSIRLAERSAAALRTLGRALQLLQIREQCWQCGGVPLCVEDAVALFCAQRAAGGARLGAVPGPVGPVD